MANLKKQIMRGIYYAYAIHLFSRPLIRRGIPLIVLALLLTSFVSIQNVLANLSRVEFTALHTYMLDAVRHTELWTILILALIAAILGAAFKDAVARNPRGLSFGA